MVIWMGLGGIALACMAAGYLVGMMVERSHWERVEFNAEIEEHEKRIEERTEERATGRHRMSQPRAAALPSQPAAVQPDPKPGPVTLPRGGSIGVFLARNYRAARGVDTVLLAPQAAPHLTGAADTGTFARVKLPADVTDTGELRAIESIGDEMVSQIERGELV
jgi:hypothetical protein